MKRKIGDIITWNAKDGKQSGEIIGVKCTYEYMVLIEPQREKHMILTETEFERNEKQESI